MVTVKEISKALQVTPRTIYRWIDEGAPIEKIGSKHYAESIDIIKDWLKDKK